MSTNASRVNEGAGQGCQLRPGRHRGGGDPEEAARRAGADSQVTRQPGVGEPRHRTLTGDNAGHRTGGDHPPRRIPCRGAAHNLQRREACSRDRHPARHRLAPRTGGASDRGRDHGHRPDRCRARSADRHRCRPSGQPFRANLDRKQSAAWRSAPHPPAPSSTRPAARPRRSRSTWRLSSPRRQSCWGSPSRCSAAWWRARSAAGALPGSRPHLRCETSDDRQPVRAARCRAALPQGVGPRCAPCTTSTWTSSRASSCRSRGPSGSGKSTLLQLLGGLDTPTAGTVMFDGKDLSRARDRTLTDIRSQRIGFIFQQFNLIPTLSAADNVAIAIPPRKMSKRQPPRTVVRAPGWCRSRAPSASPAVAALRR